MNISATASPFPAIGSPGAQRCPLPHWGVIRALGSDAAAFLHGQLTQDIQQLALGQARQAGYCSAKGRLLATFIVWRESEEELLLVCDRSVLDSTLKRLSMFVLRAKCKLSDATQDRPLWGMWGRLDSTDAAAGNAMTPWSVDDGSDADAPASVVRLTDVQQHWRVLWVGRNASAAAALQPNAELSEWQRLQISSGLPMIEERTAEQFVPQMINYELIDGVNFQKGCYPGQEVVARSQYRATAKRRMFLFRTSGSATAGTEVFHSADAEQPAGLVVNAVKQADGQTLLLAEVKLTALAQGTLHLSSNTGAMLEPRALPYAVPIEASATATSGTL
ncbi:MAG: tRNA-modifying protein YgfZ [Pseudomonadota bacterium]